MAKKDKTRQDKTSSTLCRLISCCVCPLFDVLSRSLVLVRRCVGGKDSGGRKHKAGDILDRMPPTLPNITIKPQHNATTTQPHPPHSKMLAQDTTHEGKKNSTVIIKEDCLILANSVSNEPLKSNVQRIQTSCGKQARFQ